MVRDTFPDDRLGNLFERSGCCAIAAVQIVVRARDAAVTRDGMYENANKLTAL